MERWEIIDVKKHYDIDKGIYYSYKIQHMNKVNMFGNRKKRWVSIETLNEMNRLGMIKE